MIDAERLVNELRKAAKQLKDNMIDERVVKLSAEATEILLEYLEKQTNEGWISVKDRLPEAGVTVLAVKELKSGRRDMTMAYCIPEHNHFDPVTRTQSTAPYWVCGGNNNILYWMPLPNMPE